jgi:methylglutamate dehydrogenase subunit B
MLIPHPLLGLRDASEFTYYGDAALLHRPDGLDKDRSFEQIAAAFHNYLFLRDNPAGLHRELWYHEHGDRSWLVVTRNTLTHEILDAQLASDVARALKSGCAGTKEPS